MVKLEADIGLQPITKVTKRMPVTISTGSEPDHEEELIEFDPELALDIEATDNNKIGKSRAEDIEGLEYVEHILLGAQTNQPQDLPNDEEQDSNPAVNLEISAQKMQDPINYNKIQDGDSGIQFRE